ncbi:hypothetical protein JAAARDRAFT_165562 [Jaapia argillacea MUCL 33604]|uniref:Uncharacterized protein n=1 Tax=Jaapia argillacea MUCL 33604 TaxID=933084 RepID=A0A067P429_9AGAM|nr:hypothetical protein JAAARDRAFT_165562 [Jaapia argillacea MUCL 33604]
MSTCENIHHCRTMAGIISSCLTTLFTCTWVAIHPNIPAPYETSLEITLRRIRVMVYTLIAPELVFVWAMREWIDAGKIARNYKARKWTRTHGFFALMGGFMLVDDKGKPVRPLDPYDLNKLDNDDFPQITEAEIQDKSKRDAVSKAIIMVQTTWFILQCIARSFKHLPITEIEVATLAYTVLNLATYAFWWSKPADVRYAHPVRENRNARPEMTSSRGNEEGEREGDDVLKGEGVGLRGEEAGVREEGASLKGYNEARMEDFDYENGGDDNQHSRGFLDAVGRIYSKMRRWIAELWSSEDDSPFERPGTLPVLYVADMNHSAFTQIVLISLFIATLFGAIHCLAWHAQVPSLRQLLLWRVSSLTIIIVPLLGVVAANMVESPNCPMILACPLAALVPIAYVVARITLLVLAFMSLPSIPPGAYETVVWTTLIPHI